MLSRKKPKFELGGKPTFEVFMEQKSFKICFGNPNMMFPKQNMLSQYPQQLLTEINAIHFISQLPFLWLVVVTKMTKSTLDSSSGAAEASAGPSLWPCSQVSCSECRSPALPGQPAPHTTHGQYSQPRDFRATDISHTRPLLISTWKIRLIHWCDILWHTDIMALQKWTWGKSLRSQGEISPLLFYVSSVARTIISRRVRYQLQLMKQYFIINCGVLFERTIKETRIIGALIFPSKKA